MSPTRPTDMRICDCCKTSREDVEDVGPSKICSRCMGLIRKDTIEAGSVEIQQLRAELSAARAAMAEVQQENKHLRETLERNQRPEFLPPCELVTIERGVYEELVDGGKRIQKSPTRELRLLLRQPFDGEAIEGTRYELKVIPVWVRKPRREEFAEKLGTPSSVGYCFKCRKPVVLGEETWGHFDANGDWVLTHDGYLHHRECGRRE